MQRLMCLGELLNEMVNRLSFVLYLYLNITIYTSPKDLDIGDH